MKLVKLIKIAQPSAPPNGKMGSETIFTLDDLNPTKKMVSNLIHAFSSVIADFGVGQE